MPSMRSNWVIPIVLVSVAIGVWRYSEAMGGYKELRGPDIFRAKELYRTGNPEAGAVMLRELMADRNWSVRTHTLGAIGDVGDRSLLPEVHAALEDENLEVREAASRLLQQVGNASSRRPLRLALKDKEPIVRSNAAEALVLLAEDGDFAVLEAVLESDPDAGVRARTAAALGQVSGSAARRLLLMAVRDPSPTVRIEAVESLGGIGGDEIRRILTTLAVQDPDHRVRLSAQRVLEQTKANLH